MISDQERLWRERSREEQPVYYEYPMRGYEVITLRTDGEVELFQVNDYANKCKIYCVLLSGEAQVSTHYRKEADNSFEEAVREYKERIQSDDYN